jgi:hypothetical protein
MPGYAMKWVARLRGKIVLLLNEMVLVLVLEFQAVSEYEYR